MVAVRPADAERVLASPPAECRVFLIYGSDSGAVTERARTVEAVALKRGGGDRVLRLASDELSASPGIIAEECYGASLFGGEPVVSLRILDGRHAVLPALQPLLEDPPDAWLILEAGELQATNALRKAVEKSPSAAAFPTYPLDERGLASLIHSMAADRQVVVLPDAVEMLVALLGTDRLATRSEIDKLFLYAGTEPVGADTVTAVVGETAELRHDQVVDAALLGDAEEVETGLRRLEMEGSSAGQLAGQALRHLILVTALRERIDHGERPHSVVESARPPIFFKRRPAVEATLRRWPAGELRRARALMAAAVEASRRSAPLETSLVSAALLRVAMLARRLSA